MMNDLIFVSRNSHKLNEAREILHLPHTLKSLDDINWHFDLPETSGTIRGNSIQKAQTFYKQTGINCFSDDTGLEVEALNGLPGVDTAHYSGSRDAQSNMNKLLKELGTIENRKARFVTVITLIWEGEEYIFEGEVLGRIAYDISGNGGFGYDPVFIPQDYVKTFAELDSTLKNEISHRARAMNLLAAHLKNMFSS
jgi:XTP/dITP diphosphohydrolase